MAKDLNSCNFIGRLGKDPEVKVLGNGNTVANFSIACSDDYKDKSGEPVQQTNWINITAYGKLGEICGQYLTKGSQVYVSGKQVTRKWQDQSGADRYSTDINISDMQMLGSKGDSSNEQQSSPSQAPQQPQAKPQNFDDFDDDLPF